MRVGLVAIVLIIAAFLRFYHFTSTPPGLYPDEAMDGNNAAEAAATGHFQVFYPEDNGREGLYVNLIALFLKAWPIHEPWVVRLPAAVAGTLTVLGLYLLAAELFGFETGLLAAFLLATSFWHIDFSRVGFRAILAPLFLTWSFYWLLKSFHRQRRGRPAYGFAALAGIAYGLGFCSYIAYRVTPLLFLLFIPFFARREGFMKKTAVFIVCTFIVAAPLGYYFVAHPADFFGRTSEIAVTNGANPARDFAVNLAKTFLMFNVKGDGNWRHNISGAPELIWPVGLLFILGIGIAAAALARRRKERAGTETRSDNERFGLWLAVSWLILAAIPAAASNESIPHALRSILMLPPAIMLAAIGGIWLYRLLSTHGHLRAARVMGALFLVAMALVAYYDYFVVWGENPNVAGAFNENYVDIGRAINRLPASTPKYVIVSAGDVFARGVPVMAETTMFMTDSFTAEGQAAKNIHYLLPSQTGSIPPGTPSSSVFNIN